MKSQECNVHYKILDGDDLGGEANDWSSFSKVMSRKCNVHYTMLDGDEFGRGADHPTFNAKSNSGLYELVKSPYSEVGCMFLFLCLFSLNSGYMLNKSPNKM